jgi:pRiA4b ORF-3-like protein
MAECQDTTGKQALTPNYFQNLGEHKKVWGNSQKWNYFNKLTIFKIDFRDWKSHNVFHVNGKNQDLSIQSLPERNQPSDHSPDPDSKTTLAQLHGILQVIMGWQDEHLHKFTSTERIMESPTLVVCHLGTIQKK